MPSTPDAGLGTGPHPPVQGGLPRAVDVGVAALALVVSAPLLGVVALAVLVSDGRPVLFSQERVGRGGALFRILKFRTMRTGPDAPSPRVTAGGDPRVTGVGRWLRRLKLDELPQLLNVLGGSMSLVGPRPELPEYVALYSPEERRVLDIRPGLTDPATLRYRHEERLLAAQQDSEAYYRETLMPEKLRINLEYAATRSAISDLGVLARTAWALLGLGRGQEEAR